MTWENLQILLIGKVFLIGLSFLDKDDQIIEKYQTHGIVEKLTDNGIFVFKRSDGSIFKMPYHKDSISYADAGEYRAKDTGDIVLNPDYIMVWDIVENNKTEIEKIKQFGFSE
jgi:hypothetical protein